MDYRIDTRVAPPPVWFKYPGRHWLLHNLTDTQTQELLVPKICFPYEDVDGKLKHRHYRQVANHNSDIGGRFTRIPPLNLRIPTTKWETG